MPNEKRAIRSRLDFSKIPTATQIPNLIEVQRRSYERFLLSILRSLAHFSKGGQCPRSNIRREFMNPAWHE